MRTHLALAFAMVITIFGFGIDASVNGASGWATLLFVAAGVVTFGALWCSDGR